MLVAQDSVLVEQFSADGMRTTFEDLTDTMHIDSLNFSLQLSEIYR